jgi:signal transduction histidine kinase
LDTPEGFPHSFVEGGASTMKGAAAAVVVVALLVALWGLAVSLESVPTPGVDAGLTGGVVASVVPGSPGWRDGVRAGQNVLSLTSEDGSGSWAIRTSDGGLVHVSVLSEHIPELRGSAVIAGAALLIAVLGLLLLKQQDLAGALGGLAIIGGSVPLTLQGQPLISSAAGVLGAVVVGIYLISKSGHPAWRLSGAVATVVGVAWLVSRMGYPQYFDGLDQARAILPGSLMLALGVVKVDWHGAWQGLRAGGFPTRVDLALVTAALSLGAILLAAGTPPIVLVAVLFAATYLYPRGRRIFTGFADRIVFADVRERSGIAATEAERQRLASDIHDSPLQQLAGVIKRLERIPEVGAEVDTLVNVAGDLRRLSTELRPPALDDLGLGPALQDLAALPEGGAKVTVELDDRTGFARDRRLPGDVEVAAYRIAMEAVRNSRSHAEASSITVAGAIAADRVEITITDDGRGIDRQELRAAEREGHFGIASMRQRAAMVGGVVDVGAASNGGTSVIFRWPA